MSQLRSFLMVLLVGFLFWAKGMYSLDPDFGFHLRMGEIILRQGIPPNDLFSYTMPSFPDIDEAWLLDIGIALLYPRIGWGGLAAIFTALALGALLVVQGIGRESQVRPGIRLVSLLLSSSVLLIFSGVRPQAVSWFFLAVVLRILLDPRWKRYGRFALPLLFIFWSNLHGGFVAGLGTIGVTIFSSWLVQDRNDVASRARDSGRVRSSLARMTGSLEEIGIFLLCILATSVNPYGWRIYDDVGVVVTSSTARWTIAEWYPTILALDLTMGMLFSFSLFFIYQYWRAINNRLLILYCGYFLAALSSLRNVPIWILVAYPATMFALQHMWEIVRSNPWGRKRYIQAERLMLMASLAVFISQGILIIGRSGSSYLRGAYPVDAVRYLQRFPSSGTLFADYGWGGYLIWHLPEKKTFVDGRMALWTGSSRTGESANAFAEYMAIISQKQPVQNAVDAYGIDTVLLPVVHKKKPTMLNDFLFLVQKLFMYDTSTVGGLPSVQAQLLQSGWRVVYQDQTAEIWRKGTSL